MKKHFLLFMTASALMVAATIPAKAQLWNSNGDDIYNASYNTTPKGKVGIGLIPVQDNAQYYRAILQIHGKSGNNNVPAYSPIPLVRMTSPDATGTLDIGIQNNGSYIETASLKITSPVIYFNSGNTNYGYVGGSSGPIFGMQGSGFFWGGLNIGGGISTVHPGYTLSVRGKVICTELKVQATPWPDYVFNDSYKLKNLDEVEDYIKENKHLPDVPSASEVEANGMEVGEMVRIQMQKIEELTLYMIELKKENEELRKEIEILKSR